MKNIVSALIRLHLSRGTSKIVVIPAEAGINQYPNNRKENNMQKYVCGVCGYVYDPEQGDPENDVAPGTAWENVPDDWVCPVCGADKDSFEPE